MLKYLKTNKAQAVMGEYVLVFLLAIGMVTAMTVYFKRVVQARMFDARNSMFNMVRNRTDGYYTGALNSQYEPYYGDTESTIIRQENTTINLLPEATTGIFHKIIDETTAARTQSETAAPREAN